MLEQFVLFSILIGTFLLPTTALAGPKVTQGVSAEKEVTVASNGKSVTKLVRANRVHSHEIIAYTVKYANKGNSAAINHPITMPIPKGTVYVPDSAKGDLAPPVFSFDRGKTFNTAALLSYNDKLPNGKIERRVASVDEYTHIRWVIKKIPVGAGGKLTYKVRMK